MPTGQAIVNAALTQLGILEQGGTPSNSDSVDALAELNAFWDAWGIDEDFIYSLLPQSGPVVSGTRSYTVGTGGDFNFTRPSRIYKASYVTGSNRNELKMVDSAEYFDHNDLVTSFSATPDEVYYDWNVDAAGLGTLYLYPCPQFAIVSPVVELICAVPFTTWALGTNYQVPAGYQDALNWVLAYRCLTRFGAAIGQETTALVTANGLKGEARIREANRINRMKPAPAAAAPQQPQIGG
jgi:hypothetical protein